MEKIEDVMKLAKLDCSMSDFQPATTEISVVRARNYRNMIQSTDTYVLRSSLHGHSWAIRKLLHYSLEGLRHGLRRTSAETTRL